MDSSTGFHVYSSGRKGRGSKLLTAALVIVGVAVVGGGLAFWFDRPRLVKHVAERSHLALPAAWALGTQGPPPEAREPLVAALETGEPRLRALAARALGAYRSRDLVAELGKAAVSDADTSVRRAAVAALDHAGQSNAIPFIRHALGDADPGVQAAACSGVATFGLDDQVPVLIDFLGSMDSDLRLGAKRALVRFLPDGEAGWEYDREAWTHWYASGGQRR